MDDLVILLPDSSTDVSIVDGSDPIEVVAGDGWQGPKGDTGATGATGATGPANSLSIGTVTTGAAGSSASATITGSAPTQTLNLTIPRGDTGVGAWSPTAADKYQYSTGVGTAVEGDITAAGRALLDDADAAAQRATLGVRDVLSTDRTYYVRVDGSDANNGLTDSSGGAFLTLQHAWDVVCGLDANGHDITIQLADGTYTDECVATGTPVGVTAANPVLVQGNTTTPANVVINVTGGNCIQAGQSNGQQAHLYVDGMTLRTTTSGNCLEVHYGSSIKWGNKIVFGTCAGIHVYCHTGGYAVHTPPGYTISGSANQHFYVGMGGLVIAHGTEITFSASVTFGAFAYVIQNGILVFDVNTFVNKSNCHGLQYSLINGGRIFTGQTSLSYMPGDSQGVEDSIGDGIDCGTPWTSYTPTVSAIIGSFSSASATGRYRRAGKTVFLTVTVTIANVGTGSFPLVSLPSSMTVGPGQYFGGAKKGGDLWQIHAAAGGSGGVLSKYDNSSALSNGDVIHASLVFEIA